MKLTSTIGVRAALVAALATLGGLGTVRAAEPAPAAPPAAKAPAPTGARLVTLGTAAGPSNRAARSQPASLLQVDGRSYLIDAGDGVSRQLAQAGVQPVDVSTVFLTHLHFDHTAGLASLMGFAWIRNSGAPMNVYGPPGTQAYVEDALKYLSIPEGLYASESPNLKPIRSFIVAHDVDTTAPQLIYQDDKVRVTAVENSHYVTVPEQSRRTGGKRSYAYRFDTPYRSIVFTGDTGPSTAVETLARGADVLVSEVMDIDLAIAFVMASPGPAAGKLAPIEHMRREHLSPEEVGKLATKAGVRMVVLNHVGADDTVSTAAPDLAQQVRKHFKGVVVISRDGDEF